VNPAQDAAAGTYPTGVRALLRRTPVEISAESLGLTDTPPAVGRAGPDRFPVIPGFEILAELGRGGMGVVYKARQTGLNRTVALKMIIGGPFADPEVRARFQAEAEAVARLQHPNIVQIFAVGTEQSALGDGFAAPYFAQEFMDDGSLEGLLAGVPHPPREAARLVATLARAVHHAHEAGIVHRDLKPANVLLRRTGEPPDRFPIPLSLFEPKVADFGLAKQINRAGGPRTVSGVVGTPEYMAPEQASGDARIGPGVDVYALGLILYQLLTGLQPFAGGTPLETLDRVLRIDPMPPARLQPGVPRNLETVCLKCLHKQPHRRYATALALAEDLERYLEGRPVLARPVGLPERAWRWTARRPTIAALIAAVVLTAVAGVAGVTAAWLHALNGWREADQQRGEAETNRDRAELAQAVAETNRGRAEAAQAVAETRRREAEANLYLSRVSQARFEARSGSPAAAERLLDLCAPSDGAPDRRGWEWHHLKGVLHADLLTIPTAHDAYVTDLAFSPDGRQLATAGGSPFRPFPPDAVRVWEVWGDAAGRKVREFPHPRMVWTVAYLNGGREVAWSSNDRTVQAAEVETGRVVWSRQFPAGYRPVVFSPDGRWYGSVGADGKVRVWDAATGADVFSAEVGRDANALAFGPAGLLAVSLPNAVRVWDVPTGRAFPPLEHAGGSRGRPAFSPDGRLVAQGTYSGLVRVWELETGKLVQTLAGHSGGVLAAAFAPAGDHLATAGADRTVRLWSVRTGAELLLFRGHDGRVSGLCFHPSGRFLASCAEQPGDVKVWDLTRHPEYVRLAKVENQSGIGQAVGFSADGGTLLVARTSGWLQSGDSATGADLGSRPVDLTGKWLVPTTLASFSADGRLLATVSKEDTRFVTLTDVATGNPIRRLEHTHEVVSVALSRDGRRLAASAVAWQDDGRREVRVWEAETGRPTWTTAFGPYKPGGIYGVVALSPDGRLLAHDEYTPRPGGAGATVRVVVRATETGEPRLTTDPVPTAVVGMAFGPGGELAIACRDHGVLVYDARGSRWLHGAALPGSREDGYTDLAFSPDGRRLAGVSREQVLLWDVATGQAVLTLRGAPPRPSDNGFNPRVAWSPDGRRLAATNWDHSASVWDSAERATPAAKAALHRAALSRPWPP
jgi:WD40 repeat protein/serine/threonine protein kinase